jgi:predicted  nucleic acid-binding Zn-ribbon protein
VKKLFERITHKKELEQLRKQVSELENQLKEAKDERDTILEAFEKNTEAINHSSDQVSKLVRTFEHIRANLPETHVKPRKEEETKNSEH